MNKHGKRKKAKAKAKRQTNKAEAIFLTDSLTALFDDWERKKVVVSSTAKLPPPDSARFLASFLSRFPACQTVRSLSLSLSLSCFWLFFPRRELRWSESFEISKCRFSSKLDFRCWNVEIGNSKWPIARLLWSIFVFLFLVLCLFS